MFGDIDSIDSKRTLKFYSDITISDGNLRGRKVVNLTKDGDKLSFLNLSSTRTLELLKKVHFSSRTITQTELLSKITSLLHNIIQGEEECKEDVIDGYIKLVQEMIVDNHDSIYEIIDTIAVIEDAHVFDTVLSVVFKSLLDAESKTRIKEEEEFIEILGDGPLDVNINNKDHKEVLRKLFSFSFKTKTKRRLIQFLIKNVPTGDIKRILKIAVEISNDCIFECFSEFMMENNHEDILKGIFALKPETYVPELLKLFFSVANFKQHEALSFFKVNKIENPETCLILAQLISKQLLKTNFISLLPDFLDAFQINDEKTRNDFLIKAIKSCSRGISPLNYLQKFKIESTHELDRLIESIKHQEKEKLLSYNYNSFDALGDRRYELIAHLAQEFYASDIGLLDFINKHCHSDEDKGIVLNLYKSKDEGYNEFYNSLSVDEKKDFEIHGYEDQFRYIDFYGPLTPAFRKEFLALSFDSMGIILNLFEESYNPLTELNDLPLNEFQHLVAFYLLLSPEQRDEIKSDMSSDEIEKCASFYMEASENERTFFLTLSTEKQLDFLELRSGEKKTCADFYALASEEEKSFYLDMSFERRIEFAGNDNIETKQSQTTFYISITDEHEKDLYINLSVEDRYNYEQLPQKIRDSICIAKLNQEEVLRVLNIEEINLSNISDIIISSFYDTVINAERWNSLEELEYKCNVIISSFSDSNNEKLQSLRKLDFNKLKSLRLRVPKNKAILGIFVVLQMGLKFDMSSFVENEPATFEQFNEFIRSWKASFPNVAMLFNGNGSDIEKHTKDVYRQYLSQREFYVNGLEDSIRSQKGFESFNINKFMMVLIAVHDIGKSLGKKSEEQHIFTAPLIEPLMLMMDFSKEEINLARTLIDNDVLGEWVQGKNYTNPVKLKKAFVDLSSRSGLNIIDYFKLQRLFYISDASSYDHIKNDMDNIDGQLKFKTDRLDTLSAETQRKAKNIEAILIRMIDNHEPLQSIFNVENYDGFVSYKDILDTIVRLNIDARHTELAHYGLDMLKDHYHANHVERCIKYRVLLSAKESVCLMNERSLFNLGNSKVVSSFYDVLNENVKKDVSWKSFFHNFFITGWPTTQAFRVLTALSRNTPFEEYVWLRDQETSRKNLLSHCRTNNLSENEALEAFAALQALTMEAFSRTRFPGKDEESKTVLLARTVGVNILEDSYGIKNGEKGLIHVTPLDCVSIGKAVSCGDSGLIIIRAPWHRGIGGCCFGEDFGPRGFNGFSFLLHNIEFSYIGKFERGRGEKGGDHNQNGVTKEDLAILNIGPVLGKERVYADLTERVL